MNLMKKTSPQVKKPKKAKRRTFKDKFHDDLDFAVKNLEEKQKEPKKSKKEQKINNLKFILFVFVVLVLLIMFSAYIF